LAKTSSATKSNDPPPDQDGPPEVETTYRFLADDYPLKLGDIFLGVPTLFVNPPLMTLDPGINVDNLDASADGINAGPLRIDPPIPESPEDSYGPVLGSPTSGGRSYSMLISHSCDFAEKAHPYRQLCAIYPITALPDDTGLRGFVWRHPYRAPSQFYPLPSIGQHPTLLGQEHLSTPSYANLRHVTTLHIDVLARSPRIASLTQRAKHLLLRKLGILHLRLPIAIEHFAAIDAKYPSDLESP
jgi:hypothetical protein